MCGVLRPGYAAAPRAVVVGAVLSHDPDFGAHASTSWCPQRSATAAVDPAAAISARILLLVAYLWLISTVSWSAHVAMGVRSGLGMARQGRRAGGCGRQCGCLGVCRASAPQQLRPAARPHHYSILQARRLAPSDVGVHAVDPRSADALVERCLFVSTANDRVRVPSPGRFPRAVPRMGSGDAGMARRVLG